MRNFVEHRRSYISYCLALFIPGRPAHVIAQLDTQQPAELADFEKLPQTDLQILVEEGRRAADSVSVELAEIRGRAQLAIPLCLLLLGTLTAQLATVRHEPTTGRWLLLSASAVLSFVSLAALLAICVVNVTLSVIHPAVLSTYTSPIAPRLARDFALNATDCNRVLATARTVLRDAILYVTLAGVGEATLWALLHTK
jgi:hypothetical protein